MKTANMTKNLSGLTIIEVLIASVVFMIGFSIMVFFLGEIVGKYSSIDQIIAFNLAQKYMESTISSGNYTELSKIDKISNIAYKIERIIEDESGLYRIRINIIREKTNKLLVSLYNEKYVR